MLWAESGIWLYGIVITESDADRRSVLLLLNDVGDVLEGIALEREPFDLLRVRDGELERLLLLGGSVPLSFRLLALDTGEILGIVSGTYAYLELCNPLDPDGVSLVAVPGTEGLAWVVRDNYQIQLDEVCEPLTFYTPSLGDNQRFAPGTNGTLMLLRGNVVFWRDGSYLNPERIETADRDVALFWGPCA
jgi:hypothetical protein